jgi:hypothetical protein
MGSCAIPSKTDASLQNLEHLDSRGLIERLASPLQHRHARRCLNNRQIASPAVRRGTKRHVWAAFGAAADSIRRRHVLVPLVA